MVVSRITFSYVKFLATVSIGLICLLPSERAFCQFSTPWTNEATTGTTLNKLAKSSGGTAIVATTSDTSGIIGIVVGGAGKTGTALVANSGMASCVFDGATTADDYVVASTTTGGDCHDTGSQFPGGAQVLGRILSTNAAGGTYSVFLFGPEQRSPALMLVGNCSSCAIAAATTTNLVFGAAATSGTETRQQIVMTRAGTLSNFYLVTGAANALGAGSTLVCHVRKNAANTNISITSSNGDPAQTYSDTANTATVVPGDLINVQCINNSAGASAPAIRGYSLELLK